MAVGDPSTVDIGAVDWTIIEIKCSITICRRKEAVVFKICYQKMKKTARKGLFSYYCIAMILLLYKKKSYPSGTGAILETPALPPGGGGSRDSA